jgi:hypothetical protein
MQTMGRSWAFLGLLLAGAWPAGGCAPGGAAHRAAPASDARGSTGRAACTASAGASALSPLTAVGTSGSIALAGTDGTRGHTKQLSPADRDALVAYLRSL